MAINRQARRARIKLQTFQYAGTDKKGNPVSGEINAASLSLAKASLRSQEINIHKITKKSTAGILFGRKKVTTEQATIFTRQMATMISAGIPMVQAFNVIIESAPSGPFNDMVRSIKVDVETGTAFSKALIKYPTVFDPLYCSLVEAGEQSGTLDVMMGRIATYKEKTESLKRKIKKAMYYPAAIITVALVVTTLLLVKVVPTFKQMFEGFGAELPAFTLLILNISGIVQKYTLSVFIALCALIFLFIHSYQHNLGFRHFIESAMLRLPIFGGLIRKSAVARFARTLATTSASGVPLGDALDSVAKATGNIVYERAVLQIKEYLLSGEQLRPAIKKTKIFPPMLEQMVGIGEESGSLEDMLSKVAGIYEEEVDLAVDSLSTLLEPLILVILGVIIGGLVIAMYLPIFKLGAVV
jgi:type IV pilus assembly protein PilC